MDAALIKAHTGGHEHDWTHAARAADALGHRATWRGSGRHAGGLCSPIGV
jgi:hypothetical protein